MKSSASRSTVLVIDDEANLRRTLAEILEGRGYLVLQAASATEAIRTFTQVTPDLIFCDWKMPGSGGEEVLLFVRAHEPLREIPLIVVTAHGTSDVAIEAVRLGAYDFIAKPFDLGEILLTAERALEHLRLHREVARLRASDRVAGKAGPGDISGLVEQTDGAAADVAARLIGSSPLMLEVFKNIGRAARTESTVLVRGESGTGKELVARAIHEHGARARGPFVAVNCAALPDTLLESELFGHERGAFTGASARKPGRFELARGGTLVLDEIGDITPAMQAKLLRVLQERRYERLGGTETLVADVRIVAATNRDLELAVAARDFREDLYYRLNVISIALPPLRDRRSDIVALAEQFAADVAHREGVSAGGFTADAVLALLQYDFPGNVRELENIVERATLMAGGRAVTAAHLALDPSRATAEGSGAPLTMESLVAMPMHDAVSALERDLISRALHDAGGNKADAARRLGVHRRLLYKKLAEYGLL